VAAIDDRDLHHGSCVPVSGLDFRAVSERVRAAMLCESPIRT
jgi:hypothetical protein